MSAPSSAVIPGCEPISHVAGAGVGAVVVHGFTGSPYSVRGVAEAVIARDIDVEVPRLPGHGTSINDMLDTRWRDWIGEVDRARTALADRVDRIVLVGQSMGATLCLASALDDPVAGVVCVNPLTRSRTADELEMIDDLLGDGIDVVPGEGSDIADPDGHDISYDGTPLAALRSLLVDGVAPITTRFHECTMPLRLLTSRDDHVVAVADSEHLARTWGGPVDHTWLERSYHVATRDLDRAIVEAAVADFVQQVAS